MSTEGVYMVIRKIREEILALAQAILDDDSVSTNDKVKHNTLKNSNLYKQLRVKWTADIAEGENPIFYALFNHYVHFIEWTRPPRHKKRPPIDVLRDWAARNGIPTDAGTLWAISYAIWRDGHKGRPIFATLDKRVDEAFDKDWGDWLFDAITEQLNEIFTD